MIGLFDSGLGGLSVLAHVRRMFPDLDLRYVADQARAPYGVRPLPEVRHFACQITDHLVAAGADVVVVACNAASAAALHHLRDVHPGTRFVGMEPAVKPAVQSTKTGVVGVLTTAATFQGELFASVVDRFAADVVVQAAVCDGWVESVEGGRVSGPDVEDMVAEPVSRLLEAGADTLVLGCTHYPFLVPVIRRFAGETVTIVDPAPAVARQLGRVVGDQTGGNGELLLETSGDADRARRAAEALTGIDEPWRAVTFGPP